MSGLILRADARHLPLPDRLFHCVVTSPPYWGSRDYGLGTDALGLEKTPEEYVRNLVEIFREVRRTMRDDATLWLNMGDCFNAAGRGGHGSRSGYIQSSNRASANGSDRYRPNAINLKPKDQVGIPWMLTFALRADGWYLRSDIVWAKSNPMPESCTDRPTKAHEYVFLLSKSERYHFGQDAVRELLLSGPSDIRKMLESKDRIGGKHKDLIDALSKASAATNIGRKRAVGGHQRITSGWDTVHGSHAEKLGRYKKAGRNSRMNVNHDPAHLNINPATSSAGSPMAKTGSG